MTARILTALLLACTVAAIPRTAASSECGDLNGDCSITIRDAFVLLGRALDFNYELLCPYVEECPSDASLSEVVEDCFADQFCQEAYPERPYCDGHVCAACSLDQHCDEGWTCDHSLYRCMPHCFYLPPAAEPPHSALCGDMDDSGSISVSDALAVLRRAIGLSVELRCPSSCLPVPPTVTTTSTVSSSTNTTGDQCFDDQDCIDLFGPSYVCNAYTCVQQE